VSTFLRFSFPSLCWSLLQSLTFHPPPPSVFLIPRVL
jgi:hypothetical protein